MIQTVFLFHSCNVENRRKKLLESSFMLHLLEFLRTSRRRQSSAEDREEAGTLLRARDALSSGVLRQLQGLHDCAGERTVWQVSASCVCSTSPRSDVRLLRETELLRERASARVFLCQRLCSHERRFDYSLWSHDRPVGHLGSFLGSHADTLAVYEGLQFRVQFLTDQNRARTATSRWILKGMHF